MDIVFMNGGLGNQVFQYIFARYLEETKKVRVYIDDMYFHLLRDEINRNITIKPDITVDRLTHNGYEMDYIFPNMTKPLLLSEHIDNNVWQHMVNTAKKSSLPQLSVARQLLENGFNLSVLIEAADYAALSGLDCPIFSTPGNQYNTSVAELVDNTYYYGYWINPGWFNRYKHILLKDLAFRPVSDPHNKQYERKIRECRSVGVHIRRGDFVRLGWALPESYYKNIMTQLSNMLSGETYFIFSDDPKWCRDNMKQLGIPEKNSVFIEGNFDYKNNYIDLQLMTYCNILVVGSSSFSYLAGLLNQTPGFQAIHARNPPSDNYTGGITKVNPG